MANKLKSKIAGFGEPLHVEPYLYQSGVRCVKIVDRYGCVRARMAPCDEIFARRAVAAMNYCKDKKLTAA